MTNITNTNETCQLLLNRCTMERVYQHDHRLICIGPVPGKHECIEAETSRPTLSRRHFEMHFLEFSSISLKISLKFVPKVWINNIPALFPILAWRRPDDKPVSEPMVVTLLSHICVTRPQWVNTCFSAHTELTRWCLATQNCIDGLSQHPLRFRTSTKPLS